MTDNHDQTNAANKDLAAKNKRLGIILGLVAASFYIGFILAFAKQLMQQGVERTATKLAIFAIAMFGFGYALVPLYDVFCEVVGINGKTGKVVEADIDRVDMDRLVTVEFDTNVNADFPWEFDSLSKKIAVHPGQVTEVEYVAVNRSDRRIVGRAVPSVAPTKASLYFNKTECFCFTEQALEPGEKKVMPVRFVVDADLPEKIKMMTLSYTFFEVSETDKVARSSSNENIKDNINNKTL